MWGDGPHKSVWINSSGSVAFEIEVWKGKVWLLPYWQASQKKFVFESEKEKPGKNKNKKSYLYTCTNPSCSNLSPSNFQDNIWTQTLMCQSILFSLFLTCLSRPQVKNKIKNYFDIHVPDLCQDTLHYKNLKKAWTKD